MSSRHFRERFEIFDSAECKVDIAVVGAGVSGAYVAWRLKQNQPQRNVVLFEYGDRVGGRLYSKSLPGMPHVHAELGGMRFIPAKHKMVGGLVDYFGIPVSDFPMGAPAPTGNLNNIYFLRRHLLRARDIVDPAKLPYLLNPTEQWMDPDQLQFYVMKSLFPNADKFTQNDWYNAVAFDGEPLYTIGFWNLLYRMLSSEAYQFMDDAGGYYTNVANTNAVSSLPVDDFSAAVKYQALRGGYQQLPEAFVKQFVGSLGGNLFQNHRLDSFGRRGKDGPYAMKFIRTQTDESGATSDKAPEEVFTVDANHIILAMPRRALELVVWEGFQDPWLREHIGSVVVQEAFKIFLAYPYPWWRQLGLIAGRTITDMPIRQAFYFDTEGEQVGADIANLNSLMMVSYNDLGAVPFWKALENGEQFEGHVNRFIDGRRSVPAHRFTVTKQMVDAAQLQIREAHNLKYIPEPYTALYHDWSEDPYGGGWHGWKAGYKYWEIMPRMRHPLTNERVFICGEAYSDNQGWVEGALQSAELLLEEHFELPRPRDWLPDSYDLGPTSLDPNRGNRRARLALLSRVSSSIDVSDVSSH